MHQVPLGKGLRLPTFKVEPCDNKDCRSCKLLQNLDISTEIVMGAMERGDYAIAETGLLVGVKTIEELFVLTDEKVLHEIRAHWIHVLENVRYMDKEQELARRMVLSGIFDQFEKRQVLN